MICVLQRRILKRLNTAPNAKQRSAGLEMLAWKRWLELSSIGKDEGMMSLALGRCPDFAEICSVKARVLLPASNHSRTGG
jgi:hypothetical protein